MIRTSLALGFLLACTSAEPTSTSTTTAALQCFHTSSQIVCGKSPATTESRTKIEDFYPSACFDGDADADGTPDYLDVDFLGSAEADAEVARDELRCPRCNRGPGTQNDFRLELAGNFAELERGKVYVRSGDRLTVPTNEGALTIVITPTTEIEDGQPAPGAEIRVEGTIVDGELHATRLKTLCPAPTAMPDDEVPPDTTPPDAGEPIILL